MRQNVVQYLMLISIFQLHHFLRNARRSHTEGITKHNSNSANYTPKEYHWQPKRMKAHLLKGWAGVPGFDRLKFSEVNPLQDSCFV